LRDFNIIAISGKFCSGKTTLADELVRLDPRYTRVSLATSMKSDVSGFIGRKITNEIKDAVRPLLQSYPSVMKALYGNGYWTNRLTDYIYDNNLTHVVVDDWRYPYEMDSFKDFTEHVIAVRLWIPEIDQAHRYKTLYGGEPNESVLKHDSETALDDYEDFDKEMKATLKLPILVSEMVDYLERAHFDFAVGKEAA
jgi:hypothetical protein